mgnify:CR=1 FL=1
MPQKELVLKLCARERILLTATKLFYSRGIRSTGIDLIIAESGVAKMTFYRHFPSKQSLILEYLRSSQCFWLDRFTEDLEKKSKDPKKRLLAAFDILEDWCKNKNFDGCALIKSAGENLERGAEEIQLAIEEKTKIADLFARIAREAGLRKADQIGDQWLLLFDGAIVRCQLDRTAKWARVAKGVAEQILSRLD